MSPNYHKMITLKNIEQTKLIYLYKNMYQKCTFATTVCDNVSFIHKHICDIYVLLGC